jgi:hypothetical protein
VFVIVINGELTHAWYLMRVPNFVHLLVGRMQAETQVHTQNISRRGGGWGADPEAVYNLCFILKIML